MSSSVENLWVTVFFFYWTLTQVTLSLFICYEYGSGMDVVLTYQHALSSCHASYKLFAVTYTHILQQTHTAASCAEGTPSFSAIRTQTNHLLEKKKPNWICYSLVLLSFSLKPSEDKTKFIACNNERWREGKPQQPGSMSIISLWNKYT